MPPTEKEKALPWYRKTWILATSAIGGLGLLLSQASEIKEAWDGLWYPEIKLSLSSLRVYSPGDDRAYRVHVIVEKSGKGLVGPCKFVIKSSSGPLQVWKSDLTINLPYGPSQRSEIVPFVVATEIPLEPLLTMECPNNVVELPFGRGVTMPVSPGTWFAVIGMFYTKTSLSKPEALAMQTANALQKANRNQKIEILRGFVGDGERNIIAIKAGSETEAEELADQARTVWGLGNQDAKALENQNWKKVADCTPKGCIWQ